MSGFERAGSSESHSDVHGSLLELILRMIPYAVFWKDVNSVYLGCNEVFAGLAGLDHPDQIVGTSDYDLPWSKAESDAYRADDRTVMDSGVAKLHIIETQVTAAGEQTWVDTSKTPLRDRDGQVIGVLGVFADITEQKETEIGLERTRRHLEDAIDAIDAGLVMYDAGERLVFCNEHYKSIYDKTPEAMVPGMPYEEVLRAYAKADEKLRQTGNVEGWVADRLEQHRRCERKWVQNLGDRVIRVSDRRTRDGGTVSLRTDITEETEREAELSRAKESAVQANEAKTGFLANMSHEIRTPMSAILGFADVLLNSAPRADQVEAIETIHRNGEHLLKIINDILDLSKIDAGKVDLERIRVDPFALVDDVVKLMMVRAEGKGLSLEAVFDGVLPLGIESDRTRIRQILVNLVGNAIKFTETGGVTVRVSADRADSGGLLRIRVEDTGIGLSDESLSRIFGAFEQADVSTTRRYGGTGLGLAISRRLANLLGGEIDATSKLGSGSVFELQIPVESCESWEAVGTDRRATEAVAAAAPADEGPLLDGLRILLAEDGPDNQLLFSNYLSKAGAAVSVAADGQKALEYCARSQAAGRPFDLVLMDMQMPVLDGYGATRALRDSGFAAPILALTAHAMAGDRERCVDAGCDDYLSKPVRRSALTAMVAQWASRSVDWGVD